MISSRVSISPSKHSSRRVVSPPAAIASPARAAHARARAGAAPAAAITEIRASPAVALPGTAIIKCAYRTAPLLP